MSETSTLQSRTPWQSTDCRADRCAIRSLVRRGISLLEVLISAFIITVGLLGVAALMPIGHLETARGARADRAGAMARMAFRDFKVRGMSQPRNWVSASGGAYAPTTSTAMAIDPLYLADSTNGTFPAVAATMPRMARISLSNGAGGKMNSVLAEHVFRGQDDLYITKPTDITVAPLQELTSENAASSARLSEGRYSWLATMVPREQSDLWMLSVVVFHQRDFTGEKVFDAQWLGPTEISISMPSAAEPRDRKAAQVALDFETDWLLLSQQGERFAWYRIVASGNLISPDRSAGNNWRRYLTLEGPDLVNLPTQAFIFPGVVTVQQRTVRQEGPSAWSAQP